MRPGLDALLDGAAALGVPVWLASGGFDFYIAALLGARMAAFARRYHNRMRFAGDRLTPEFPHARFACDRYAVCKGLVCDEGHRHFDRIVFAGDGTSDRCVIGRADVLCAVRGSLLATEAGERGAAYRPFDRLDEILPILPPPPLPDERAG